LFKLIGQTISHYKIIEKLGEGGMGVVYRAQDTRLLRQVAVKFLPHDLLTDENNRRRFMQEAQTASSLNHPNICVIHDINEVDGAHFIVMELVEGETLGEILERRGPLPEKEVIDITIKVCEALASIHAKGIFHRDIKADNIMISRQGYVKVMDFGLAKLATDVVETIAGWESEAGRKDTGEIPRKEYPTKVVLSSLSGLLGTVSYMSPEQAQGKAIDQRSDIFSLGVVLYELLTATRPFEAESNDTILSKIIADPPEPIKLKKGDISPAFEQLINRCLEKDLSNRLQTISDMLLDLQKIDQSLEIQAAKKSGKGIEPPPADSITAEPERRQITVMFCGLTSLTSQSEQLDPEELHSVLPAYQELCDKIIQRYEGHVAQYLGNEIMVYFGYPQAHEDDARRAVLAGFGIVEGVRRLSNRLETEKKIKLIIRAGIHTGLVVAGEKSKDKKGISIVGETPNIATQVLSHAKSGTLVITVATYQMIKGFFDCRDLGSHSLRGISQPISMYEVLHESTARSRFDKATGTGITPLVGRDHEVNLLLEGWNQAVEGKGNIVLLSGEAGIGKSRLLRVLKEHVAEDPQAWLSEFQCSPYFKNSAFYPIIDFYEHVVLQFNQEDSTEERMSKLEGYLIQYGFSLQETVPLIASLLSLPLGDRYSPLTLTPEKQKQKTMEVLLTLLLERAAEQPVLLVVEDLHWADPSTLELLNLIIDKVPTFPILILLTFRPDLQSPWKTGRHLTEITLNRLSAPEVQSMVALIIRGKTLPAEIVKQLTMKTDGIPLFVEEMTKMILESGLLKEGEDRYEMNHPLPEMTIPAKIQDMLMARLDTLAPAKDVAQLGATIGREFPYELLQAISTLDDKSLNQKLDQLLKAELLYQRGKPPQAKYLFKHALIQDAAYQSLLKSKRQQYHQKIAQVLAEKFPKTAETQPELLAHHYTEASLLEQAIPFWQKAGQQALQRSANLEAISHLNKGLELVKTFSETPERIQQELSLLTILGPALIAIKGYAAPEVENTYTRAFELCNQMGESIHLFQVLWGLWAFYFMRQDTKKAQKLAEQLLNIAKSAQDKDLLIEAHLTVGHTDMVLGKYTSALQHHEEGIGLYDPHFHHSHAFQFGQDPGIVCLTWAAWDNWYLGYPDRALERVQDALNLAHELSHPHSMAYAPVFAASVHLLRREVQKAQKQAEIAIELTTEHGFPMFLAMGLIFRGWALATQGKKEGISQMQLGIDSYKATGAMQGRQWFLSMLSEGYWKKGQFEQGLTVLDEALAIEEETETRGFESVLYRLKGQLLLSLSAKKQDGAEVCFHRAIEIACSQSAKSFELRAAMSMARLWQIQGKRKKARQLLAPIYNWFTEGFDTQDLKDAKALLDGLS
jgi:TOMM system kinase/cyclase fusion protein